MLAPARIARCPLPTLLPPLELFRRLFGGDTDVFWLDGGDGAAGYLGAGEPWMPPPPVLPALRAALADAPPAADPAAPPFRLGLVGWLGYELRAETMHAEVARRSRLPDAAFLRVDRAVAIHPDGRYEVLLLGSDRQAAAWRDELLARAAVEPPPLPEPTGGRARWRDDELSYLSSIAACQRAIRDGDAYLLNLTTEIAVPGEHDPVAVYARLRAAAPSHHGALLRIGEVSLLSASPERFLTLDPDGTISTHPIKGTRPRGSDPAADEALRAELGASAKERAENVMIVDLMRNDLGRVAVLGSVSVPSLLRVESYRPVHQLVSTVQGQLREGLDGVDVIEACFPAGSMTGAPKRRAIELLDAIEARPRGLYAGAFGYLGLDGRVDLAMTIRSIVMDASATTIGVGGGITAASNPGEEFDEVALKADALLSALGARTHP